MWRYCYKHNLKRYGINIRLVFAVCWYFRQYLFSEQKTYWRKSLHPEQTSLTDNTSEPKQQKILQAACVFDNADLACLRSQINTRVLLIVRR